MSLQAQRSVSELRKEAEQVEKAWWLTKGIARLDDPQLAILSFQDVSTTYHGKHAQTWPPEILPCSLDEPFVHVFHFFRFQANKKHRHPFRPALSFELIIEAPGTVGGQPMRISYEDANKYSTQQVVDMLGGSTTLPYVRNDNDKREEHLKGQLKLQPWDRSLPPWYTLPPASWIAPTHPSSVLVRSEYGDGDFSTYIWHKVPTLHLPGYGASILPSTTTPSLIASHVFLVARPSATGEQCIDLDGRDEDYVLPNEKLEPPAVTLDDVKRLLLGRYIQVSTTSFSQSDGDADERPAKRARQEPAKLRAAVVWGYEPTTRKLYCVAPSNTEFVVDLSAKASDATRTDAEAGIGPLEPEVVHCEWLGPVSLTISAPEEEEPEDVFGAWFETYDEKVKVLNASEDVLTFKVGEDGKMLAGDVNLSKGPEDEFECIIEDVNPGSWIVTRLNTSNDGSEEDEVDEDSDSADSDLVVKVVMQHTDVKAEDLMAFAWEEVGTFSVDSGVWGIISHEELEKAAADSGDREATLESFADWATDEGSKSPAGIVVSGDDGGYTIQGKKLDDAWVQFKVLG